MPTESTNTIFINIMNKILRLFAFVVGICIAVSSYAGHEITIGYCPNTLSDDADGIQNQQPGASLSFQAAILVPGSRLKSFKGQKIAKVRFACSEGLSSVFVWVRNDLNGYAIGKVTKVGVPQAGWNEVTLAQPVEITGEDLYFGYMGKVAYGGCILCDGEVNPNGTFFYDGSQWTDMSKYNYKPFCIQVIIETDSDLPLNDLAIEKCTFSNPYTKTGDNVTASININNYGEDAAKVGHLNYAIANGETHQVALDAQIAPEKVQTIDVDINTANITGRLPIRFWLDTDDINKDNDTISTYLNVYDESYPRKTLIEHFTTLKCVNCPTGLSALTMMTKGRKDYVWVAHHIGYQTDELTESASYALETFGITSAPLAMFDRRANDLSQGASSPSFGIAYGSGLTGNAAYSCEKLTPYFNQATATPAFVSVNIENHYDAATRKLTTTVSGERNEIFESFYDKANLTVEMVEDGVNTRASQTGSGDKVHDHVFREALTRVDGDEISWNGNNYSETYTFTIPESWNDKNVRVVAFVNKPIDNTADAEVLNANDLNINYTTGINNATTANAGAQVLSRKYFNLQGQRINTLPEQGAYLEQVETTQGVQTIKHVK